MTETILPAELPHALEGRPHIALLSLDCFDTLLWRDSYCPRDIFATLDGCTPHQRMWAEVRARSALKLRTGGEEAPIEDIYRALLPNAPVETHAEWTRCELAAEARHCFAFAPTVALMRDAQRRGIPVVIVSDTYLNADQLGELIRRAAGEDVLALIDEIFCSSTHGMGKAVGLFAPVLRARNVAPETVLHIGDNPVADLEAGKRHGIEALHLRQFLPGTVQRIRLEAASAAVLHSGHGRTLPAWQPHRATLALHEPAIRDPAEALGFSALGPVLQGFASWIAAEEAELARTHGGTVHKLFLMRDGFLPHLVHDAMFGDAHSHAIEMSRFTATAASLTSKQAVQRFLDLDLGSGALDDLLRQLHFKPNEIAKLRASVGKGAKRSLYKAILGREEVERTVRRGRAFADRLIGYLRRRIDPKPGDTLMLIDLGYNGTVQNLAEPLLREAFGTHVAGRYLLLREQEVAGLDKRGMIDGRTHDGGALEALCANVAVLEQLCTAARGSTIDYDADGEPIRSENSIKQRQSETRERAQQGALRFARVHGDAILRRDTPADIVVPAAAAALARLMFFPLPGELDVISQFEHDINLGGDTTVKLFDGDAAAQGLRERGLFYLKGTERMYLPGELRGRGLPLNLTLMTVARFNMPLTYADFCDSGVDVPLLLANGRDVAQSSVRATPTHDGYFLAAIPVGMSEYAVGLQFGRDHEWLQIQSARFVPLEGFMSDKPQAETSIVEALPSLEGIEQVAPHLFQCSDPNGFLMVPPPPAPEKPMLLTVVFRPLVERARSAAPIAPAQSAAIVPAAQ